MATTTMFSWKPACGVAWLELRKQTPNGDKWSAVNVSRRGKVPDTIVPPVRYSGRRSWRAHTYLVPLRVSDHSYCDLLFTGYCRELTVGSLTMVPKRP